jgi:hypothetical protein
VVAAVVAATVIVVAANGGDDRPSQLPVLAGSASGATDEGAADALGAPASGMPIRGGLVYRAGDGLPALSGSGRAYRLPSAVDVDRVTALAHALGLSGGVSEDQQGWHVVDGDHRVDVYRSPGAPWSYFPDGGVISVDAGGAIATGGATASGGSSASAGGTATTASAAPTTDTVPPTPGTIDDGPGREPGDPGVVLPDPEKPTCDAASCTPVDPAVPPPEPLPPERPADLPSAGDAERIALDLLAATGMNLTGAKTSTFDQLSSWGVQVDPVLDGVPTFGFTSYVSVGGAGVIESASGFLATPEAADTYPLIGTGAAIDRLNEGVGLPGPQPLDDVQILPAPAPGVPQTTIPGDVMTCMLPEGCTEPGSSGAGAAGSAGGQCPADQPQCLGGPLPTCDPATCDPVPPTEPPVAPPVTEPAPAPVEPTVVTLVNASSALIFVPSFDGTDGWLVPGYLFQADDGGDVVALAVSDEFLLPPDGAVTRETKVVTE